MILLIASGIKFFSDIFAKRYDVGHLISGCDNTVSGEFGGHFI